MKGWGLVITTAVLLLVVYAIAWGAFGVTDDTTVFLVRCTARSSCLLFLLAFIASPLRRLWQSSVSLWLVQNRRFLGLSMAVSHTYHAVSFFTLDVIVRGHALDAPPYAAFGYVFLLAMTVTSFPRTTKLIGPRNWRILHTAGMYYFWMVFAGGFAARLGTEWVYIVAMGLMVTAMIIRIAGRKAPVQLIVNYDTKK